MTLGAASSRWLRRFAVALAVTFAWAVLNRTAALFEIRPGLAFFFPAAAITVVAGTTLGWVGALCVLVANFASPWGAAVGPLWNLLFGLPAALWAALIAVLPRTDGLTWPRLRRFLLVGLLAGSLASALLGATLLSAVAGGAAQSSWSLSVILWWVPDFVTAVSFGLALVVLLSPAVVLGAEDLRQWRLWRRNGREIAPALLLAVAGAGAAFAASSVLVAPVHWFIILLLPPVLVASLRGGVGAGLVVNGFASGLYLALVLATRAPVGEDTVVVLSSTYANLCLFVAFALAAGLLAGRNRQLLEHVRRQSEVLSRGLEETVEALAAAMQTRERASQGHVTRVARLTVLAGRELAMSPDELALLRRAAILHDVGRLGIPEAILNKAAELEAAERTIVAEHMEMGMAILERVEFLHPVLAMVRYHQERWDGSRSSPHPGRYGLAGEEIPLGSRIIAAAEAFDAMTHDRPYRPGMSRQAAVAELWRCSGTQFDPAVVAALTRVLGEGLDLVDDEPLAFGQV